MPRLIPDGPDIPGELIQKQEAGEMVFFCGAGISVPTGLPSFPALVDHLYESLNVSHGPREKMMIAQKDFAGVLGHLENRVTGNAMRLEVARLLSSPPRPDSLRLHRALLQVSRTPSGMRLVTTNYDDNFARANVADDLHFDAWPTLPDLDHWNSVVHLHGRIQASLVEPNVPRLVLTGKDFGEAYLNKRWAAEFVSKLMDRYTVVFVGYSMADVVIRYLTDAVAGRRVGGDTYALVGYTDKQRRERREAEWTAISIRPIFYHSRNEHEELVRTVEEWARLASDPHQYRIQVAVSGLKRLPDKKTLEADPDRVVWAVKDPAAIWPAFNRIRQTSVLGANAAEWLEEFAVRGLLSGTVQPKRHERGPAGPVVTVRAEHQMLQTDTVADAVAYWIEIHAHSPEVFRWVINNGHNIGFELRRRLWDRLTITEEDLPDIPPRLRRLWILLVAEPPEDAQFLLRLDRILSNLSREYTEATDDILLGLLRPRLSVFPGPPPYRILSTDDSTPEQVALLSCGHTEVILGCRDDQHRFNVLTELEPSRFGPFLRRHAVTLTEYLKTAFLLLHRSDHIVARFIHSELSEAFASDKGGRMAAWGSRTATKQTSEPGRRFYSDHVGTWTVLLDWVRQSYRALPKDGKERDALLRYWAASSEKMLWRLALEAIEQDSGADFDLVRLILHRNAQEVLWDPDCGREVRSVLRQVGTRASSELQIELLDAVQGRVGSGTPRSESDGTILASVGPRLAALHEGGVILGAAAAQTLAAFEKRLRASSQDESKARPAVLTGPIREVVAWLRNNSGDVATFREFSQRRPVAAMLALQEIGHGGDWPTEMWKATLGVVETKVNHTKPWSRRTARVAKILLEIPEDLFERLQHEISKLVEVLAERWPGTDDSAFWHLWTRGWEHRSQRSAILSRVDALTNAMNTTAGKYATAAIKRIGAASSNTPSPITNEQESVLSKISGDVTGSAGIVMLVFGLSWLYGYAPGWTSQHILPRMRWGESKPSDERYEEVCALWGVIAFRGSITDDLVRALGSDLWMAVQRHKQLDNGEKLVRFFIYVSVSPQTDLIDEPTCRMTAHIAIRDSPLHVGLALRQVLDDYDQPAEQVWCNIVRPWLDQFWPHEKILNTVESSSALVQVIMGTGDAFPEAVAWANGYLMASNKSNDRQIGEVRYHKNVWKPYPREAVALLHSIVPEVELDTWQRLPLADMLKTLREVDATIPEDSKFVELERRATR